MDEDCQRLLESKITAGNEMMTFLAQHSHVDGCSKLSRKIKAEMKFLLRLRSEPVQLKRDHLRSSNLDNLQAICQVVRDNSEHVVAVLAPFRDARATSASGAPLVVDVVLERGACWCKVVSRNAAAMHRVTAGHGDFGQRSVVDQARRYLRHARANPHFFRAPLVRFVFSAGVGRSVRDQLASLGVHVAGEVIDDSQLGVFSSNTDYEDEDDDGNSDEDRHDEESIRCCQKAADHVSSPRAAMNEDSCEASARASSSAAICRTPTWLSCETALNLDVTAMLAYVSNLTNGFCECVFSQPLLRQQAEWERKRPVKPLLDSLFVDRRLLCCRSAERAFCSIVDTVAGPQEKQRARALLVRVHVLDDPQQALFAGCVGGGGGGGESARGKVNERSSAIFGLGEQQRIPTVTANVGFVRAAASRGLKLTVITHGSRALSEAKQPATSDEHGARASSATCSDVTARNHSVD